MMTLTLKTMSLQITGGVPTLEWIVSQDGQADRHGATIFDALKKVKS